MTKAFFKGFLERDGIHILTATLLARSLSFLASWIALQFIPNSGLGLVIYAINVISLIIPISGLGASQGLLRFGALFKTTSDKNDLFAYVLKKGSIISVIMIFFVILLSPLLTKDLDSSKPYLILISFQIFTLFLMESLKTQFRVLHQNKIFASIEISYSILLVLLVFIGSWFFKETGYVMALIAAPLFIFMIYIKRIPVNYKNIHLPDLSRKKFWKYSFFTGLSNVANQLLIVLDIILIGQILKDPEMVTLYKYLSLIPFSLLFLPRVLILTDFVNLTQNYKNKDHINKYIRNYIRFFFIISVITILLSWIFQDYILLFFGDEFSDYNSTFMVLILGISSILLLRGLFGNLLSVIGKAYINYWISVFAILINLITNFILIPKYGILGAAITSAIIMWITSLLSVTAFYHFYRRV
jgi:O-antigen/teichoic acid export membrane protein